MRGGSGGAICWGMIENIRTQHPLGHGTTRRPIDPGRHFGRDGLCIEKIGDLLLRASDRSCQFGLRPEDRNRSLDVGSDLHTSFLVETELKRNKETCHAPHKGTGIVARAMTIAENVKRLRKEAGLSQGQLAEVSGVSQQLISQIEGGKNNTTKHLSALAKALGCKLADIDPQLTDVISDDPFPDRYLRLPEQDRLVVQSLIERLERSRQE